MDDHQKAYVCIHVFDEVRPIRLVSREGGDWCFLCGESHPDDPSSYRAVGVGHLFSRDSSLEAVADLPPGWEAERSSATEKWIRTRCDKFDS
jgi:hypothetical protein